MTVEKSHGVRQMATDSGVTNLTRCLIDILASEKNTLRINSKFPLIINDI